MQSVFKWQILTTDRQEIEMPVGAEVLTVQCQNGKPCIWARVDTSAESEFRAFRTYGTGHPIHHPPGRYVGTYQLIGGALVFHVFEEPIASAEAG